LITFIPTRPALIWQALQGEIWTPEVFFFANDHLWTWTDAPEY